MDKERECYICKSLWQYNGGFISPQQLAQIVKDSAETHFAFAKLRGMNIRLSHEYRTQSYGVEVSKAFRRRIEKEQTLARKNEMRRKEFVQSL